MSETVEKLSKSRWEAETAQTKERTSLSKSSKKRHRQRSYSKSPERETRRSTGIKDKYYTKHGHSDTEPVVKQEKVDYSDQTKKESRSTDSTHRYERHRHNHRGHRGHRDHMRSHRHHDRQDDDSDRRYRSGRSLRGGETNAKREEQVDDTKYNFGNSEIKKEPVKEEEKSKPDYGLSGNLADDTNTYRGVVVKYNEPPEARKPKLKWRLYPFKGDESLPILHIHRQSGYLIGRDRKVADLPIDHPSCSKQHAVLQFRSVEYTRSDGSKGRHTRPYIIDLSSANGTFVNNKQIESQRYVELLEKDTIKFGFSSRDYVILHDNIQVESDNEDD